jgi:hypothetical protein
MRTPPEVEVRTSHGAPMGFVGTYPILRNMSNDFGIYRRCEETEKWGVLITQHLYR